MEFLGKVDRVYEKLSFADLMLMPSEMESFGLAALEGMACELPSVSTAVGGVPADAAAAMIGELEGDRGFYAGAAGWCDQHGDGRWVVSIRCAVLSPDRTSARAYSGGGIVADSDVADEIAETTTKFRTILSALGAT